MVPSSTGTGNDGAIISLNPDGTQRWLFETGDFMIAGPNIGPDGNVYAVTDLLGIGLFSLTPSGQLRFHTGRFTEYGSLGQEIVFGGNQLYFDFDMFGVGPARLFGYDLSGTFRFEATGVSGGEQAATGPNGNVVVPTFPMGTGLSLGAFGPDGSWLWNYYEFPGNVQSPADVGPDDNTSYSARKPLDAAGARCGRTGPVALPGHRDPVRTRGEPDGIARLRAGPRQLRAARLLPRGEHGRPALQDRTPSPSSMSTETVCFRPVVL